MGAMETLTKVQRLKARIRVLEQEVADLKARYEPAEAKAAEPEVPEVEAARAPVDTDPTDSEE